MIRRPHLNVGLIGSFERFELSLRVSAWLLSTDLLEHRKGKAEQYRIEPKNLVPEIPVEQFSEEKLLTELGRIGAPEHYDVLYAKTPNSLRHIPIKWNHRSFKRHHVRIHRSPRGAHFHG